MHFELSPLIVWIVLWIVSEFQVNIFSNKKRYYKMFLHNDDNDDAKALAIPLWKQPSQAKKGDEKQKSAEREKERHRERERQRETERKRHTDT